VQAQIRDVVFGIIVERHMPSVSEEFDHPIRVSIEMRLMGFLSGAWRDTRLRRDDLRQEKMSMLSHEESLGRRSNGCFQA
jgi:hypothetical protein